MKFLARRGLVYREGKNWTGKHWAWLRAIQRDGVLETEDQVAFGEYLALLDYKLDRREELDRLIEMLTLEPAYKDAVGRLCCLKGISTQAAMVLVTEIGDFRRFEHPGQADGLWWAGAERALERRDPAPGLDHEGGQQPRSACAGAGGVVLPLPAWSRGGAEATPGGPAAGCGRPQLEGAAPTPQRDRGGGGGRGTGGVRGR